MEQYRNSLEQDLNFSSALTDIFAQKRLYSFELLKLRDGQGEKMFKSFIACYADIQHPLSCPAAGGSGFPAFRETVQPERPSKRLGGL
jgi:hypothetical protein